MRKTLLVFCLLCCPVLWGQALFRGQLPLTEAPPTNSNTVFVENWGSGPGPQGSNNPQNLCWTGGPSSCTNYWTQSGAAPASLAATPGTPGTNIAAPMNLKMVTTSGSASWVGTYGYFPTLPSGTTFDLYFTIYVFNNSMGAYDSDDLVAFSTGMGGGNRVAAARWHTTSAGTLYLYGWGSTQSSSTAISVSMNTWHTVHMHVTGGSGNSCVNLDTGTCSSNTFTENSYGATALDIGTGTTGGNLQAMTYYIGWLRVDATGGYHSATQPYMYIDQAGGTAGSYITTTTMLSSTHCPVNAGAYTGNSSVTTAMSYVSASGISPSKPNLYVPIQACGTIYTGNDSLLMQYDNSVSTTTEAFNMIPSVSPATTAISWGHFWMTTVPVTDSHPYSPCNITANSGAAYMAEHFSGGAYKSRGTDALQIKTGDKSYIGVSPNHWYWVSAHLLPASAAEIVVFDPSNNWAPLACTYVSGDTSYCSTNATWCPTTACVEGDTFSAVNTAWQFGFGRDGNDSETPTSNTYFYWADFIIDTINAKFPLIY